MVFPEPVIGLAIEPKTQADVDKLGMSLAKLAEEDPTFRVHTDEETGQTIISGMGELHLEIIRNRMERDFKLNVRVHKPRVSYRETIRNSRRLVGEFQRPVAGVLQSAKVELEMEPFQGDESIVVVNRLGPSDLAAALQKVLEQSIRDGAQGAGMLGYPLIQVRFTIREVKLTELENPEAAVQAAALDALHRGVSEDNLVLLEPIMRLEVTTPDEFMGSIHSDLMIRRALITGTEQRGDLQVIHAEAPLAAMFGYSTHVRSLSQGRASYSMEPSRYAEAPAEVLREMLG